MEIPKNNSNGFQVIKDEDLREDLIVFDKYLRSRDDYVIPLPTFTKYPFPDRLRLWRGDMQKMITFSINCGVMTPIKLEGSNGKKSRYAFDRNQCLAFAALTWATTKKFSKDKDSRADIGRQIHDFPWREIVESAKDGLGDHPLSTLINNPIIRHKIEYSPSAKKDVKEKIGRISQKFPEFNTKELDILMQVDLFSLIARVASLPLGQVEEASIPKHGALHEIIRAVSFIDHASKGILGTYDKTEDSCSVEAYRQYLIKSRNFLLESKNKIANLRQLVETMERKIIFDTTHGVSEKFYLNRHSGK